MNGAVDYNCGEEAEWFESKGRCRMRAVFCSGKNSRLP